MKQFATVKNQICRNNLNMVPPLLPALPLPLPAPLLPLPLPPPFTELDLFIAILSETPTLLNLRNCSIESFELQFSSASVDLA